MKKFSALLFSILAFAEVFAGNADGQKVYSVKIDGQISSPQTYIVKRAVRTANSDGAKILVVDLDTPGGDLGSTVEIMETLKNFGGKTVCYVNPNAISAGSLIAAACDEIYFAPNGIMGAAEAVDASGGDIAESMRRKITSYLGAKVRSHNLDNPRRAAVQRAMNDPNFELKIGGRIIKPKGELLSLTAKEAAEIVDGSPLLSNGTAKSVAEIASVKSLKTPTIAELKITWSERAAKYISAASPILMGIGFLLIFVDIKSGGFGLFGGIGVGALLVVFLGANMCGLAGHEEALVFLLGAALVALELFLLQGFVIPALAGAALMIGSLAWALGGIWTTRNFEYNFGNFADGLAQVVLGLLLALAMLAALWKFLPKCAFAKKLVLETQPDKPAIPSADIGKIGTALTDLMPSGRADIGGKTLEVVAEFGHIRAGEKIEIVGKKDFNFAVRKVD